MSLPTLNFAHVVKSYKLAAINLKVTDVIVGEGGKGLVKRIIHRGATTITVEIGGAPVVFVNNKILTVER